MVHASAKYNSENNLLEEMKPLVAEYMKICRIRRIRQVRQVRCIRWILVCICRFRVLKVACQSVRKLLQNFIGTLFNLFSPNIPFIDKPGSWFLLAKRVKNTCGRVTFLVKVQVTDLHIYLKCLSSTRIFDMFCW